MKRDEIIVLLKEQLQLANEQLQQANATVSSWTTQVNELIERDVYKRQLQNRLAL